MQALANHIVRSSADVVGSEILEVGRIAESTKRVGGNGKEFERERERESDVGRCGMAAGSEEDDEEEKRAAEEPSNLHPATAPNLGRTNH